MIHLDDLYVEKVTEQQEQHGTNGRHGSDEENIEAVVAEDEAEVWAEVREEVVECEVSLDGHDEVQVEDVAVEGSQHTVDDHGDVVAVVEVADTAAGEPAVVVTLQDARVTHLAVVRARRQVEVTLEAVTPAVWQQRARVEHEPSL